MPEPTPEPPKARWQDTETLRTVAVAVVIACGSWWMLGQLAVVLRPLLVAVFLAYVLLPTFIKLRRTMPGAVGIVTLAALAAGMLAVMAVVTYASLLGVLDEFPRIQSRAIAIAKSGGEFVDKNLPWLVADRDPPPAGGVAENGHPVPDRRPEVVYTKRLSELAKAGAGDAAAAAASGIGEAVVAGLYLFFLLLEASRFPTRVRGAYEPEKAEQILGIFNRITVAINGYLKAKVISGLILAGLVAIVLWGFGVRFVFLWAVFTFLTNFIPYVGSVLGYGLPAVFAGLMLEGTAPPVACAITLLVVHAVTGTFVEPLLIGKAVGLSPLVILVALTIWGTLWGLLGMFLAVPLTMVVLIVLDNVPSTKPFARLVLT